MYKVKYKLLGEWFEVVFYDLESAKAFACDFVEYRITKIGDDFFNVVPGNAERLYIENVLRP